MSVVVGITLLFAAASRCTGSKSGRADEVLDLAVINPGAEYGGWSGKSRKTLPPTGPITDKRETNE
jgi:hypothetical protein